MSSVKQISVAVVGAGYMAREHIKAFNGVENAKVVGIASRTESKAQALKNEFGIEHSAANIADLYEKTQAALVVVTVPELSMKAVCEECVKYPWKILVEKPAGYNFQQATEILNLCGKAKYKVHVALNRRCYSSTQSALNDLRENKGQRFIHVFDQQDPFAAAQSGQPKEVAYNWMYANSVHLVDYLRLFGRGKVLSVEPIIPWNDEVPMVVMAKVVFESGDIGIYEGIWRGPGPWAVQVVTQEKRWEMRPLESASYQSKGERKLIPVEINPVDTSFKAGLYLQAQWACQETLGVKTPLATIDDSFESMSLVRAIFGR
jgi:predicted dehydrogenase